MGKRVYLACGHTYVRKSINVLATIIERIVNSAGVTYTREQVMAEFGIAAALLDKIEKRPVRLVGITLSCFTDVVMRQSSLFDADSDGQAEKRLNSQLLPIADNE